MKQYTVDNFASIDVDGNISVVECEEYDYTPIDSRYVNLAELLDYLNSVQSLNDITFLIHNLTKPIPGSD